MRCALLALACLIPCAATAQSPQPLDASWRGAPQIEWTSSPTGLVATVRGRVRVVNASVVPFATANVAVRLDAAPLLFTWPLDTAPAPRAIAQLPLVPPLPPGQSVDTQLEVRVIVPDNAIARMRSPVLVPLAGLLPTETITLVPGPSDASMIVRGELVAPVVITRSVGVGTFFDTQVCSETLSGELRVRVRHLGRKPLRRVRFVLELAGDRERIGGDLAIVPPLRSGQERVIAVPFTIQRALSSPDATSATLATVVHVVRADVSH